MHCWIGFGYTFGQTKYCFENYGKVVDKATEYGIKIAFENTEGEEYLFALMDYFKDNKTVGFFGTQATKCAITIPKTCLKCSTLSLKEPRRKTGAIMKYMRRWI